MKTFIIICMILNIIMQIINLFLEIDVAKSMKQKMGVVLYRLVLIGMFTFMLFITGTRPYGTETLELTDVNCQVIFKNGKLYITYLDGDEEKTLKVDSESVTYKPDNVENTKITIEDGNVIITVPNN